MYRHLYDQFKHWYREGGSVWFYSDPHFADEEMKYLRANYIGDEEQVKRINSKLGKNDTLVILGDIGDVEWVKKLRGYKVLIMGNHDAGANNYKRVIKQEEIKMYNGWLAVGITEDNHLFDEVYEGPLFVSDRILLSHEPIDLPFVYNIHGHDHSNWYNRQKNNHLNVCAEHINYVPVNLPSIIKSGALSKIESIHRLTIDGATQAKRNRNGAKKRNNI